MQLLWARAVSAQPPEQLRGGGVVGAGVDLIDCRLPIILPNHHANRPTNQPAVDANTPCTRSIIQSMAPVQSIITTLMAPAPPRKDYNVDKTLALRRSPTRSLDAGSKSDIDMQ